MIDLFMVIWLAKQVVSVKFCLVLFCFVMDLPLMKKKYFSWLFLQWDIWTLAFGSWWEEFLFTPQV